MKIKYCKVLNVANLSLTTQHILNKLIKSTVEKFSRLFVVIWGWFAVVAVCQWTPEEVPFFRIFNKMAAKVNTAEIDQETRLHKRVQQHIAGHYLEQIDPGNITSFLSHKFDENRFR